MTPTSSPSTAGARVSARGWGWRHAGRRDWALNDLELEIEPGERVLLLGASGSGKSTLLHGLAGVLGGDEEGEQGGRLLIDGHDADRMRGAAGLVLQDPDSQLIMARVGDDVAFGCENLGVPREQIWPRVSAALDAVGLAVPLDRSTSALSGGQKQRLALAGLVAMRPRLLLLDEPTANLDPRGVAEVRDAVGRVLDETGATLVVVEHRVAVWRSLVTRVVVLGSDGSVMADGEPDTVLAGQAERLSAAGVWVPGRAPQAPARAGSEGGGVLLSAGALAVARARGTRRRAAPVVRDGIDFALGAGEALLVTGPNGSGKSTLALTIAGLLPTAGGSLVASPLLAGGVGDAPFGWSSRQLLSRIGTVFQDPEHQFLAATVRAELAVGPRELGLPQREIDDRVDELLQRLRLDRLAEAHPFTLSGGEKRRLSVATALATRPRVLVLDEPTFGQDSRTWRELVALLAELLDEGSALVAASHDAEFVEALATRELSFDAVAT